MKIDELFDIEYPKTLAYSWLIHDENGINFVSAQEKDNGIVDRVKREPGIIVYPAGCITVPLKGSVLMAHLQPEDCYVAHQIGVLIPKKEMTLVEKVFYVTCIRSHAFKYNYGRQADRTLGQLEVPAIKDMMSCIDSLHTKPLTTGNVMNIGVNTLEIGKWKEFYVGELFDSIYKVASYHDDELTSVSIGNKNAIAYVTRTDQDNGVKSLVCDTGLANIESGNAIVIGDTTSTISYQPSPFVAGEHIIAARAGWLNKFTGLFITCLLRQERYRYSYGRAYKLDLIRNTKLKLPVMPDGKPDWQFMENYIKSLPYGDRL